MKYFSPDFLQFFKELAANNNRDWFQDNRKRYESEVKKPMEAFVTDLIAYAREGNKDIALRPSDCIFRINKDIRFAKDKSPYKLFTSAAISPDGKKAEGRPGIYVELGPEKLGMAGGIYMPDKITLEHIRTAIAKHPKKFNELLADKTFKKKWGELQGERNKIIPAEWKPAGEICPYIYNKQFYFWAELDPELIISTKLMKTVQEYSEAAKDVSEFLDKACKS